MIYQWTFPALELAPADDGPPQVVRSVRWHLVGTDAAGRAARLCGVVELAPPEPGALVPFEALTPELVEQWTLAALGEARVAEIRAAVDAMAAAQPAAGTQVAPPWAA